MDSTNATPDVPGAHTLSAGSAKSTKDAQVASSKPPREGLPFPNEVIDQILSYLPCSTKTYFALGRCCHQLREVVNHHIPAVSTQIHQREQNRLLFGVKVSWIHRVSIPIDGLSVLEVLRGYLLHEGRQHERDFSLTADRVAKSYLQSRTPAHSTTKVSSGLQSLLLFLMYLDAAEHPHCFCPGRRQCWLCPEEIHPGDQKILLAVEWFRQSNKSMNIAYGYWHEYGPRSIVSGDEWEVMVASVLEEPIQQFTLCEGTWSSLNLVNAVYEGFGFQRQYGRKNLLEFLALQGLPHLAGEGVWGDRLFVTRMSLKQKSEEAKCRARGDTEIMTTGVRAMREFCARNRMVDRSSEERILDPQNRLLLAAVMEELLAVPEGDIGCSCMSRRKHGGR